VEARDRRGEAARLGVVVRRVVAARVVVAARRVVAVRVVAGRLATLRLAVLAAARVRVAGRRVVVVAPRATCLACLVRLSIRFSTLLTSARVLARLTCTCSSLIAARAVLSASFRLRSTLRRRSGGTRFCASRSARCPALTARPTMPDRLIVRFLFPMMTSINMPDGRA
jgi:hypothetical protein